MNLEYSKLSLDARKDMPDVPVGHTRESPVKESDSDQARPANKKGKGLLMPTNLIALQIITLFV